MEAFSPQMNSFLPLELQLPENSTCCVYVHNSLLMHTAHYMFAAGQAGQLIQHSQVLSQSPVNKHSNSQSVVEQGCFFIFQETQVLVINMETGMGVVYLVSLLGD